MKKISYWTNLCPQKLHWELDQLGVTKYHNSSWIKEPELMYQQLKILQGMGIQGIKLNIFNFELGNDAKHLDFSPIEIFLSLARPLGLEIHLCIGPYQYPLWPGIRLPLHLLEDHQLKLILDQNKVVKEFGCFFTEQILKKYGKSRQIAGFYLGNEWHTSQAIESYVNKPKDNLQLSKKKLFAFPTSQNQSDKTDVLFSISPKHMQTLARECKRLTRKPIYFNTNIDVSRTRLLEHIFLPIMKILKEQFWIGFDTYPSQESLSKTPDLFFHRGLRSYKSHLLSVSKKFTEKIVISEFEAQPWGDGRSWKDQLVQNPDLPKTISQKIQSEITKRIDSSPVELVTFWGAEFWLAAYHKGDRYLFAAIETITGK